MTARQGQDRAQRHAAWMAPVALRDTEEGLRRSEGTEPRWVPTLDSRAGVALGSVSGRRRGSGATGGLAN